MEHKNLRALRQRLRRKGYKDISICRSAVMGFYHVSFFYCNPFSDGIVTRYDYVVTLQSVPFYGHSDSVW